MQSRMSSCRSSANDFDATEHETPAEVRQRFRYFFTTTISGLSLAALLWPTRALTLALVFSFRARWTRSAAMIPASPR